MTHARPSILNMVFWAHWDSYQVLRSAPVQVLTAATMIAVGFVTAMIAPVYMTPSPVGQAVARDVIVFGLCFLLTPFFLSVHRFVLLGEPVRTYDLKAPYPRLQSYFSCAALAVLVISIPLLLDAAGTPAGRFYSPGSAFPGSGRSTFVAALRLTSFAIIPYCLALLAALAIDAPGANWRNVISDTRRHVWFVQAVVFLPAIPVMLLGIAATPLLGVGAGTVVELVARMLWIGVVVTAMLLLGAVAGARLYQVIGDRLDAPDTLTTPG